MSKEKIEKTEYLNEKENRENRTGEVAGKKEIKRMEKENRGNGTEEIALMGESTKKTAKPESEQKRSNSNAKIVKSAEIAPQKVAKKQVLADSIAAEYLLACMATIFGVVGFSVGASIYPAAFFSGNKFLIYLVVLASVFGLLAAIFAKIFFKRVSFSIQDRPNFVQRKIYKFTTYGTYLTLFFIGFLAAVKLGAGAIMSLTFVKMMSLSELLMGMGILLVSVFAVRYLREIVIGRNKSADLSNLVLIATSILAGLVLVSGLFVSVANFFEKSQRENYQSSHHERGWMKP